ncbi:FAD-dependent oxidoreductase [Candidatus Uhrbacteria bacterium]|nr:FAD-dependent oxidoreductase [Candidatus Uhrbacteria bacterium]
MSKKILILGGGAAGLAAAWRLARKGLKPHVIEMSGRVGGLAGGVELNGNIYEYGPHIFHASDPEVLDDIKTLMGDDLIRFDRTVKIKFMGEYFDFPLSITDVLLKLPFGIVVKSIFDFICYATKARFVKPEVETTESVLLESYGRTLYELFFKSYIEQVWGVPPSQFSPEFAKQRIPRMNILQIIEKFFKPFRNRVSKVERTERFVEKIEGEIFTTRRGFSLIAERMGGEIVKLGGSIHLNKKVTELFVADGRVSSVRVVDGDVEEILDCDHVISTIPINLLGGLANPAPDKKVLGAAEKLKFHGTLFVGLVVNRGKVLPASFMYFREISFNRIMDLSYFGIEVKPNHGTILIAEINCETSDFVWIEENHAKEIVINDLIRENLIAPEEILECHIFKASHAYPMYLLNYEKHLQTLLDWVGDLSNLQTIGRQGRFQYVNSHVAMKMAYQAADNIISSI